MSEITL